MTVVLPAQRRSARAGLAVAVLGALAVALSIPASATSGASPAAGQQQEVMVPVGPEADGAPVELDATIFTPAEGEGPYPAVLLAHGFGGSKGDLAAQADELASSGYVVITYTARGFGRSGGLIHLMSPDFEVADARVLVDLLAARDDVLLDAPGDPRVGIAGASYGGALALMTAGTDPRIDAVVPAITWNDLSQSLFPQYAQVADDAPATPAPSRPAEAPGVFKKQWAALFFASAFGSEGISADGTSPGGAAPRPPRLTGTTGDLGSAVFCARFDQQVCDLYLEAAASGQVTDEARDLLRRHSPTSTNAGMRAPTLLLQGTQDSLFPLGEADSTAVQLAAAGVPFAVRWVPGGHDGGGVQADLEPAARAWFDHYLRGQGDAPPLSFEYAVPASGALEASTGVVPDGYPGTVQAQAQELMDVELTGDAQVVVAPPGGAPAAFTGLPGQGSGLSALGSSGLGDISRATYALAVLPGASAVFDSPPMTEPRRVAGAPSVTVRITSSGPEATLFASVWVVSETGDPTLPVALVSPVHLTGLTVGEPTEARVRLPAAVYDVGDGERLRVVLSSTDQAYALPDAPAGYLVEAAGPAALYVPTAPFEQAAPVDTGTSIAPLALGVAALVLLGLGAVLLTGRRLHHDGPRPDLATTPLVVEGLVKRYRGGTLAVDDVSWTAEAGQVVGLLGPNGAGKTTTIRMLVGLIRADAGSVWVLGQPVTAGAPVLSRVGALIEGPGFLPHVSGRENLRAFWAATGRAPGESHVEEALEIAGLGTALERPVRSYSHGMQQRLGIAQAMLGLPELLILDEPTNGLDPPQIKAMRQVLSDYAATGRTVVISSHLLAEVEQTCTHVVVMHRGQVVAAGAVADLVSSEGTTVVVLADDRADEASRLLADHHGVRSVRVDDARTVEVVADVPRHLLVRELVEAGFEVSTADGRRQLEEVFMQVISDGAPVGTTP